MLKITAFHGPDGLQLSITNSAPPTVDDLYADFSRSHDDSATERANHELRTASKIVLVEAAAGDELSRVVTVWLRTNQLDLMVDDISAHCDAHDLTVWVDDAEFDPWAEFAAFEK